jgi:hypothetical protein
LLVGACGTPDGSDLFLPFDPTLAGAAGLGGASGVSDIVSSATDAGNMAAGGTPGEGQGGAFVLAGAGGGLSGGSPGTLPSDAGLPDAALTGGTGSEPDAAPSTPACIPGAEVCDGLDNDCDDAVDEGAACPAACAGFALEGRGYMFCSVAVSRAQALQRCALEGMRLAWLETSAESVAVRAGIVDASVPAPEDNEEMLTQIGASDADDEGSWFWVGNSVAVDGFQFWQGGPAADDGEALNGAFAPWSSTEPNDTDGEDCGVISVLGGETRAPGDWDDRTCDADAPLPFVCETP